MATPPGDYGSAHILMNFHGALPGGEVWSCGLRTVAASLTSGTVQEYADYVAQVWQFAMMGQWLQGINPPLMTFEGCTVRGLDITGLTLVQAEGRPTVPVLGGSSAAHQPDQIAVCASLLTNKAGRSGKGRIYLPALSLNVTAGRANSGTIASGAAALKLTLEALAGAAVASGVIADTPAALFRTAVQSRVSGVAGAPIVAVAIGDILDTIRGRRSKLREVYQGAGVEAP